MTDNMYVVVPPFQNGKTIALKIMHDIMRAIDNFIIQTGTEPEHITISNEDFEQLARLCVVTSEPVDGKSFQNRIVGILASRSIDLKRGQIVIGKEYTIDEEVYEQRRTDQES